MHFAITLNRYVEEKKRSGNYINRNRDHCGNEVCISSRYYCRFIIIISSSRGQYVKKTLLHLKLLVIGRCIAESAVHLTRTRRRRSATCATTKTGCTCKLNYSREPGSTWGRPSTRMRNASRLLVKLVIKPY